MDTPHTKRLRAFVSPRDARSRLARALIAKAAFEALFVLSLAAGFFYSALNPNLRGALELADERRIEGWALDGARPADHVEVQLYVDGRFAASVRADRPRAGGAGALHGFAFETPPLSPGEHEARVYAVHVSGGGRRRTLRLIGRPVRFGTRGGAGAGRLKAPGRDGA